MTDTEPNVLRGAAQLIQKGRTPWGRGNVHGRSDESPEKTVACIYGFLVRASSQTWREVDKKTLFARDLGDTCDRGAQEALAEVINEQYDRSCQYGSLVNTIIWWNDHLAKDADEVVTFLEKAAAKLEERAGLYE